jgi:hypothetical protein
VAFRHLDRLPRVGDQVMVEGITITILEMDEHRIARVRVSRGEGAEEAATGEQPGTDAQGEAATDAGEPGRQEGVGPDGDALSAGDGPDSFTQQNLPPENAARPGPAYPANEPGQDDLQPQRESKALH